MGASGGSVRVYDPGSNSWSTRAALPELRSFSASKVTLDGKVRIEVVGGSAPGTTRSTRGSGCQQRREFIPSRR